MLALVLGERIAEEVFPEPLRSRIGSAVDEILKGNNPDFLDTTLIHSLKVLAESGAVNALPVFPVVTRQESLPSRTRCIRSSVSSARARESGFSRFRKYRNRS